MENAFRSLEEFRVRTRTCDVREELVPVLLSYLLLDVWLLVRSWRKVKLREFSLSLLRDLPVREEVQDGRLPTEQFPVNPSLLHKLHPYDTKLILIIPSHQEELVY